MTKGRWDRPLEGLRKQVLEMFEALGPMTTLELCKELPDVKPNLVRNKVSNLHLRKLIHISEWEYEYCETCKIYPRAVYSFGIGEDKRKPTPKSNSQATKEYRARKLLKVRSISPFHAGMRSKECLSYKLGK